MAGKRVAKALPLVNDQMAMRFAQQYVACMDPTRAAVNTGIAYDGIRIDYGRAAKLGKELLANPQVINHIRYLNEKSAHALKLDLSKFTDVLGEMLMVTMLDYLLWDDITNGYRLKPLSMLTQAELLCLKDANQYQHMFTTGATPGQVASPNAPATPGSPATTTATQQLSISLIDKMKVMDLYAKVNSFYKPAGERDETPDDVAAKIRSALNAMESTDGPDAKVEVESEVDG